MERILSLIIGYLCGCFLTAELVAWVKTGKSSRALGTGNPGTANITAQMGYGWGLLVLLGDILKTVLACGLCATVLFPALGRGAVFYGGLGTVLGHNFPFWKGFRGGKGVAVTCAALVLFSPLWGILCCLGGLLALVLSGSPPLGAVTISTLFFFPALWVYGPELGVLAALAALVMLSRHRGSLLRIARGEEPRLWRR